MRATARRGMRRFYTMLFLVGGAIGLLLFTLMSPVIGTTTDFSVYNTGWNGASRLGATVYDSGAFVPAFRVGFGNDEAVRVSHASLTEFDLDPAASSVFIIGPDAPFTVSDQAWANRFLARGGTLILADDFGTGNTLLEAVGAGSRFNGAPLLDLAFEKTPAFIVAVDFAPHPLTEGVDKLILNYPTSINLGPRATPLAWTLNSSWLDTNGNALRDEASAGAHAFIAVEAVQNGSVVLIGEPSLFINGQRTLGANDRFVTNAVAYAGDGKSHILIDESHRDYFDPVKFLGTRMRSLTPGELAAVVIAGFGVFAVFATDAATFGRTKFRGRLAAILARLNASPPVDGAAERARVLARVRADHPDWDETVLTEIVDRWSNSP